MPHPQRHVDAHEAAGSYRSGVAARLAGMPVDTLRVWERRYGVVGPRKSGGGQRQYSSADIQRLALVKRLVDAGHAISDIATLNHATLRAMLDLQAADEVRERALHAAQPGRDARVALVGWLLATEPVVAGLANSSVKVVGSCTDPFAASTMLTGTNADIVLIELPTLQERDVELVETIRDSCRAEHVVVLYRFARTAELRRLRLAGQLAVRTAPEPAEIEAICRRVLHPASTQKTRAGNVTEAVAAPPPKFDEKTLSALADASRTVDCECPKHLVNLVMDLGSFERYSLQCAERSPADRELHLELELAAGKARAIIETALERVAIAEGFALPLTDQDG